jgi:hypothetical protein
MITALVFPLFMRSGKAFAGAKVGFANTWQLKRMMVIEGWPERHPQRRGQKTI